MSKPGERQQTAAQKKFDRAMVDSTDLLASDLDGVEFPADSSGFLLYELGRLVESGDTSFGNEDFRFLIEQGIRLQVDPDIRFRSELVGRLRRAHSTMPPRARRITPEVIGAIEDSDFSMDQIGAVVRVYTNRLFSELEDASPDSTDEDEARGRIASWKDGSTDRSDLFDALRAIGPGAVPAVADLLFEFFDQPATVETALDLLGVLESPLASRVLAYMVSEPILEESQEEKARSILQESWPQARTYILYRLRQHSHEDIPFRWLELLIEMQDERAVDRILEEVVVHARSEDYKEDLLAILALLDRSKDPGITGKLLRLMTEESAPEAPLDILEEWLETSVHSRQVEEAIVRWNSGKSILVTGQEDFNTFAMNQPECSFDQLRADWNQAYHESIGWQQWSRFPRGPLEQEFEAELEEPMTRKLSLNPGLGDTALHGQIESFREAWLVTPRENMVPLVAIYLERPRENPWNEAVYWREINGWYIRAAQSFDEGNEVVARKLLDIILQIEPDYPFATMLDDIMRSEG